MEKSNVTVTIRTLQRREDGSDSMTQRVQGLLLREEGGWTLTYREGEENGLGRTRTTLRLTPGRAVLERTGEVSSQMVFQPGEPHTSLYETPYGKLPMTIRTLRLDVDLTGAGGSVYMIYKIQLGQAQVGENRLRLTIKAKENSHDR